MVGTNRKDGRTANPKKFFPNIIQQVRPQKKWKE
jgi:hypothetical protein